MAGQISPAEPFSKAATAAYAVLAVLAVLYMMRGAWSGNRLANLYYPVHTAIRVVSANMLIYDGVKQLPGPLRTWPTVLGCDTRELAQDSQEILRDAIEFAATNNGSGASQLRGQLVVLLGETGARAEALKVLPELDAQAADFRLAAGAVYGSNSSVPSLRGKRPFEYLESSWAGWRFQARWHGFAGEAVDAGWVNDWIRARAHTKIMIVMLVSTICVIAIVFSLGLLFWMIQPAARAVFRAAPLHSLLCGEGLGILVRADLAGTLLVLLCFLHPLTRIIGMCHGLIMLTPLLFLLAHRHWRYGSLPNFFGLPGSPRACLALLGAAVCILGLDWLFLSGIGAAAKALGIQGHWAEGLDEALLYEDWPVRFVPLANGIVWSPIYEEIAFRGVLFPALRERFGLWPAALGSSIVFGSVHFYSLPGFLGVAAFGLVNALACHYTRSLLPSMAAHIGTNFTILGLQTALFA